MTIPFDAVLADLMKFTKDNGMEGRQVCPECKQVQVVFVEGICSLCWLLRKNKVTQ